PRRTDARRVQDGRAEPAGARGTARHRGDLRGDFPQAHGTAGLDSRLGLVRDHGRRLAAGQEDAAGEDREACRMRCAGDVAAVRAQPDDAAEQVTQLLPGEPVELAERRDGWARIVTAYAYPGWVREAELEGGPGVIAAEG